MSADTKSREGVHFVGLSLFGVVQNPARLGLRARSFSYANGQIYSSQSVSGGLADKSDHSEQLIRAQQPCCTTRKDMHDIKLRSSLMPLPVHGGVPRIR
jgi:hypothetical protein